MTKRNMMTIRQFKACLNRMATGRTGREAFLEYQVNAWPYPQASQSRLLIWWASAPHEPGELPANRVEVKLLSTDAPGALITVAAKPTAVLAALMESR